MCDHGTPTRVIEMWRKQADNAEARLVRELAENARLRDEIAYLTGELDRALSGGRDV